MWYKIVQPAWLLAVQAVLKVIISKSATTMGRYYSKTKPKNFFNEN
jgi:hypothetical protein